MLEHDAADSPLACQPADFAEIEARDLLRSAVQAFPGNIPLQRVAFEQLVLTVCGESVAQAIEDAGGAQHRSAQEVIARVITEIRTFSNPWLALRCLAIVFSLPCGEGENETALAAEFGVTKGGVSDICIRLRDRFGVPEGRGMKTDAARGSYSRRQIGKRARPLPVSWPFANLLRQLRTA